MNSLKEKFEEMILISVGSKTIDATAVLRRSEYNETVNHLLYLQQNQDSVQRTRRDYYQLKKFGLLEEREGIEERMARTGGGRMLLVKNGTDLRYVCIEDLFDVIRAEHLSIGHAPLQLMKAHLDTRYANITHDQISAFLELCDTCKNIKSLKREVSDVKDETLSYSNISSFSDSFAMPGGSFVLGDLPCPSTEPGATTDTADKLTEVKRKRRPPQRYRRTPASGGSENNSDAASSSPSSGVGNEAQMGASRQQRKRHRIPVRQSVGRSLHETERLRILFARLVLENKHILFTAFGGDDVEQRTEKWEQIRQTMVEAGAIELLDRSWQHLSTTYWQNIRSSTLTRLNSAQKHCPGTAVATGDSNSPSPSATSTGGPRSNAVDHSELDKIVAEILEISGRNLPSSSFLPNNNADHQNKPGTKDGQTGDMFSDEQHYCVSNGEIDDEIDEDSSKRSSTMFALEMALSANRQIDDLNSCTSPKNGDFVNDVEMDITTERSDFNFLDQKQNEKTDPGTTTEQLLHQQTQYVQQAREQQQQSNKNSSSDRKMHANCSDKGCCSNNNECDGRRHGHSSYPTRISSFAAASTSNYPAFDNHPRDQLTKKILLQKVRKGIRWADVGALLGTSKEWATSACLGQHPLSPDQAIKVIQMFGLESTDESAKWLQAIPPSRAVLQQPSPQRSTAAYPNVNVGSDSQNHNTPPTGGGLPPITLPPTNNAPGVVKNNDKSGPSSAQSISTLPSYPPADPLLYRLHEVLNMYGPTIRELILEEFGDGIMSAVDFHLEVGRDASSPEAQHHSDSNAELSATMVSGSEKVPNRDVCTQQENQKQLPVSRDVVQRVRIVLSGKFLPYRNF